MKTAPFDRHISAADRRRGGSIALMSMYAGYAMSMALRMVVPIAGAAIRNDPLLGIDLDRWGKIISIGISGAITGKLLCGYLADRFGGKPTFILGLLLTSVFVAAFACVSDFWSFGAAFFLTSMAKATGWPAMAKLIINWFPPGQYGRVWGLLSTSSRVGTMAATFALGSLLAWVSWREMLWIAVGLGIVTSIVVGLLLQDRPPDQMLSVDESTTSRPAAPHPLDGTSIREAIPIALRSRQFWLIAGSLMGLATLWDFLLLVPMLLEDTLHISTAHAARAAAAFPFGSLISVLVGGYVFDQLSRRAAAWVMGLLLTIATLCLLAFLMMTRLELSTGAALYFSLALLFLFGFSVSPCFYIPMSVFSIEFGGPHAGVLISTLDAMSFAASATFYFFGGGLAQRSWSLLLACLAVVSVWSVLTTFAFLRGESRRPLGEH